MTWLIATFLSHFVFIPGLDNAFRLPKLLAVLALGLLVLFSLASKNPPGWSVRPAMTYGAALLIPLLYLQNVYLFLERAALDLAGILVYLAALRSKPTQRDLRSGALLVILLAFLASLLTQFNFSGDPPGISPPRNGVLGNPAYVGFLAVLAGPLVLLVSPRWWVRLLLCLPLGAVAFVSRASIVAFCLSGLAYLVLKAKPQTLPWIVPGTWALAVLVTLSGLFFPSLPESRFKTWRNTAAMVWERPVFGLGRGQFEIFYPAYANRIVRDETVSINPLSVHLPSHPHNEVLNQLAETGIVGLALFVAMTIYRTPRPDNLPFALAISAAIVYSVFWFPFSHPSMAVSFWAMLGLLGQKDKMEVK